MSSNKHIPILIADDEAVMRQLIISILRAEGYTNFQQANDGQQALNLLSVPGCDIGIAFLDISMPAFTGLEVMSMTKALLPNCFFVIVSAHSALDNVLAALNDGARGFIVKPYTARKIHDIVTKFQKGTET
jgi:two-component system chemotaxis response regulator CheY